MKLNRRAVVCGVVVLLVVFANRSFAFKVSEKVGDVSISESVWQTAADSRAQLDLGDGSIIRLGADSMLQSKGENVACLSRGTALFDFCERKHQLTMEQAGRQVAINGGSGFARIAQDESGEGTVLVVCSLAGKVTVSVDGKLHRLKAGGLLTIDAKRNVSKGEVNLVKLTTSSVLITGFKSPLSGQQAIQREVIRFASLQKRGFIRTVGKEQLLAANDVEALTLPSAGVISLASISGSGPTGLSSPTAVSAGSFSEVRFSNDSMSSIISVGGGFLVVDEIRIGDFSGDPIEVTR